MKTEAGNEWHKEKNPYTRGYGTKGVLQNLSSSLFQFLSFGFQLKCNSTIIEFVPKVGNPMTR